MKAPLHSAAGSARSGCRWVLLLLCGALMACGTTQHVGERGLPDAEGIASYYADKFVGRTTANGEIYDHEGLTAAHRSLPFGTRVRTTRTDAPTRPSVVVRINDRGPFKDGRIIDLTKTAAERLNMIRDGLAEVRLEVVSYPAGAASTAAELPAPDPPRPAPSNVGW
nr:septal ring lytic transglycosylase RlpA family protein [Salinibacter altiplanensis]